MNPPTDLFAAAKQSVVVLDGGLGTLLEARGNDITGQLWSAQILRDRPEEVLAAHLDFFAAGARIATTASYEVTYEGLAAIGGGRDEADELLRRSVEVARRAVDEAAAQDGEDDVDRWVAASIGPYGAGPGRGTEYDGDYGLTVAELAAWHRPRIEVLASTDADVLLAETTPSILEVEALAEGLADAALPAMLSVTVADGKLRDGTDLSEVTRVLAGVRNIGALGVNCCQAEDALAAVRILAEGTDLPLMAYPNSGERWDHIARTWEPREKGELTPLGAVPDLLEAGVRFIGGCCRVTPREIEAMTGLVGKQESNG
ncbi:homocysteine S-methyltransferase [Acidipropionibacterium virtanenii]|uniref:Homocysteine S-methyltransferase n=1 Tax=Acidipropionibacterium virtanenii TaxID=2057246 RepID=A0A344UR64_9ACTN|nr:homocysteine S-methyltransferase [Acidipropionibacterium virtanenii]AXE37762.1 Homocysteine S-methyltransferase [Acidipropionibacterium virtanenii]